MNPTQEHSKDKGIRIKLTIIWLVILLLASFWLTARVSSDPVSLVVVPQVPRQGEPIIATFKINNEAADATVTRYQFYANGELLKEGYTTIAPGSSKTYKYAYKSSIPLGEQLNFVVRAKSGDRDYEKLVSSPPYPPQLWSSFVSFASFSTSVMSSMSTMTYYQSTFGTGMGFNVGIIITLVLIGLLIFLELIQSRRREKSAVLGRLKFRFSTVTWMLFIIFAGILYTKIVMIITT